MRGMGMVAASLRFPKPSPCSLFQSGRHVPGLLTHVRSLLPMRTDAVDPA